MPRRRFTIETDRLGNPQLVRRSPRSHSSPRHDWARQRANISNEELAGMRERERELRDANYTLTLENQTLKTNLQSAEQSLAQHREWVAHLQQQLRQAGQDNAALRRSLDGRSGSDERHREEMRSLRNQNTRLENDNERLRNDNERLRTLARNLRQLQDSVDERVRRLTNNITTLVREVSDWRRRHEDLDRRYKRLSDNLDAYIRSNERLTGTNVALRRKVDAYEHRLRRHGLLV